MVLLPLLAFFSSFPSFGSCTMTRKPTQGARSGNPTDDTRSAPEDEASSLSGPNVDQLREHYRIPEQFRLSAPGAGGRVNNPPPGDLALYVEDLRAGLRLPIPEFVRNLLDYYGLCPAQLAPNSVRLIISFALLCQLLPTNPRVSLFRAFFVLRPHPKARGWWLFNPRKGLAFITGLPSSIHGWKNQFFFVSSSSSWGFPSRWGTPRTEANENSRVDADDREDFHRLKDMSVPKQRELVTEQALYDAGLSLVPRIGIARSSGFSFCPSFGRLLAQPLNLLSALQGHHRG